MSHQTHTKTKFTAAQIAQAFAYDPETGEITQRTSDGVSAVRTDRVRILYKGTVSAASSVAYAIMKGAWPRSPRIKYLDGNAKNLAWANLQFGAAQQQAPRKPSKKDTVATALVVEIIKKSGPRGVSSTDIALAAPHLNRSSATTAMSKLRKAGKTHISGICSRAYALHGHISYRVKFGPPPPDLAAADIRIDVDEVRSIIETELLARPGLDSKAAAKARVRIQKASEFRLDAPIFCIADENGRVRETSDEFEDDVWRREVVAPSMRASEITLSALRSTGLPVSVFNLAAHQAAHAFCMR